MNSTPANGSPPLGSEAVGRYLGKPWVSGATGPDAFDCWGLLRTIYREEFGREIPAFPGVKECGLREVVRLIDGWPQSPQWEPLERPEHGCAVAMGTASRLWHVGVFVDIDGGLILHAAEGRGVVCESVTRLRAWGISRLKFYRFRHGQYPIL